MEEALDCDYILFDLDGTLSDSAVGITKSVQHALAHFGIQVQDLDELHKFIGPPLRASFEAFYGFTAEQAETAVKIYREAYTKTGIHENTLYPGIPGMLQGLKAAGKNLLVATTKPAIYARQILARFGLEQYFVFLSGAELDGSRDEKAELIRYAFEHVSGMTKDNAVMVGDRNQDIWGAKAAGIRSIGVLYGFGNRQELEEADADCIVATVDELYKTLS
jgi:phosphoglycolate phosphatase